MRTLEAPVHTRAVLLRTPLDGRSRVWVSARSPEYDRDAQLMLRVARGDTGAFEQLVLRHQDRAWSFAWRYLGDAAEAEDIVQEAFLRILKAAPRYKPTSKFSTYLFTVVARLCRDAISRKHPDYVATLPSVTDPTSNPEDLARERETAGLVFRALQTLPETQRLALVLRHYHDLSYEEIAQVLSTTSKAVDSLLQRARQSLRTLLAHLK